MRHVLPFLVTALLFASSDLTHAAAFESDTQLLKFSESVMAEVSAGDLDGAFSAMKPYLVSSISTRAHKVGC